MGEQVTSFHPMCLLAMGNGHLFPRRPTCLRVASQRIRVGRPESCPTHGVEELRPVCLQPLRLLPPYVGAGWDGGGARPDPHLRREHATPVPSFGASLLGPHTAWGSLWKEASSAVRVPSHFAPNVGTVQHAVAVGNGLQSWLARARRLLCKTWSSVTAFMRLFRVVRICSEALLPPPQCQPLTKHGRAFAPMSGRGALGDAILRAHP